MHVLILKSHARLWFLRFYEIIYLWYFLKEVYLLEAPVKHNWSQMEDSWLIKLSHFSFLWKSHWSDLWSLPLPESIFLNILSKHSPTYTPQADESTGRTWKEYWLCRSTFIFIKSISPRGNRSHSRCVNPNFFLAELKKNFSCNFSNLWGWIFTFLAWLRKDRKGNSRRKIS